jgi:tRNA(Ile)-lysidine synthase
MSLKNLSVKIKIPKLLKSKLSNKKVAQIYQEFENSLNIDQSFAVAVSGGSDSLALAFLSKIYSVKKNIVSKYFIVDHKLRLDSTKEAKLVKQKLKKFSIHAQILTWKGKKPSSNIQSLARKKRYKLLITQCNKFKISNILLGHHEDDLFENFFIRILRGSGLKGLISLDKISKVDNKNLIRPLLHNKKEDLIFIAKYVFDFYVQDPSNKDEKFKRIQIRGLINELRKKGLDKKKFDKTIKNLKDSNNVVNFYVKKNLNDNSFFFRNENKLALHKDFFQQPHEIIFRSLSESIKLIGKKYYSVRGKKLDKIISDIQNFRLFKATLGGCIIEKVNQTVIISKEH